MLLSISVFVYFCICVFMIKCYGFENFMSLFDADLSEGLRWGWYGSLGEIKAEIVLFGICVFVYFGICVFLNK